MTMTRMHHLRIILYYVIKSDCDSLKPFRRYGVPIFFISDLVATLTVIRELSKPNQLVCRLNYVINQRLVKFSPLGSKISC